MHGSHVLVGVFCMVLLAASDGCESPPDPTKTEVKEPGEAAGTRVTVEKIGWFEDKSAYKGWRRIYLFTDTATGKQYLGVTGVGVSEAGQHKSGRQTVRDER